MILNKLLESITYENQFLSFLVFTQLVVSHIHFSTKIKFPVSFFNSFQHWAGWWHQLFKVKLKACFTNVNDLRKTISSELVILRKLKQNLSILVNF